MESAGGRETFGPRAAFAERKKFEQAFRHSPKTIKTVVEN